MKPKKVPFSLIGMGLGAALCATVITRTLLGGPPTVPRTADVVKAGREEPPPAGTQDDRSPLVTGVSIGGNGLIEPAEPETRVAGAVPGRIARVAVKEGEHVELGAVLVELEGAVERASLAAAEADLAGAKADLTRSLRGQRAEDIEAAAVEASASKTRAELSASVLLRTEALAKKGAVSTEELDHAVCSVLREEAEAVVEAAIAAGAADGAKLVPEPFDSPVIQALFGTTAAFRLLPHVHGTDGYFAASLRVERPAAAPASPEKTTDAG